MLELKAGRAEETFDELAMEEVRVEEPMEWFHGNLPKNTKLWIEKNASAYYHNVMKAYWDYYEYQMLEQEEGES